METTSVIGPVQQRLFKYNKLGLVYGTPAPDSICSTPDVSGAPGTLTPSSTSQAITPSSTSAAVAWPPTAAAQTPTPGQPPVPRLQQFWGAAAPLQIPLLSLTNASEQSATWQRDQQEQAEQTRLEEHRKQQAQAHVKEQTRNNELAPTKVQAKQMHLQLKLNREALDLCDRKMEHKEDMQLRMDKARQGQVGGHGQPSSRRGRELLIYDCLFSSALLSFFISFHSTFPYCSACFRFVPIIFPLGIFIMKLRPMPVTSYKLQVHMGSDLAWSYIPLLQMRHRSSTIVGDMEGHMIIPKSDPQATMEIFRLVWGTSVNHQETGRDHIDEVSTQRHQSYFWGVIKLMQNNHNQVNTAPSSTYQTSNPPVTTRELYLLLQRIPTPPLPMLAGAAGAHILFLLASQIHPHNEDTQSRLTAVGVKEWTDFLGQDEDAVFGGASGGVQLVALVRLHLGRHSFNVTLESLQLIVHDRNHVLIRCRCVNVAPM
ncbi:hypothetical protein VP01_1367g4 [Puccinia sorghi]|uniref:Uncharacterized protein n=1 Tax=Puccinia sorghi TaxID=27349 RepID=A0A0L6VLS7_9BASI|nr:hypothetical protein VP01_1367g4 [Puccinia sorghi]